MKKHTTNFWFSVLSVAFTLVLLGIFLLISFHTRSISSSLKNNLLILVELSEDIKDSEVSNLVTAISKMEEVKAESVKLFDSDDAMIMIKDASLVNMDSSVIGFTFRKMIGFQINAEYFYTERLERIRADIMNLRGVIIVDYENPIFDDLEKNIARFSWTVLAITLFLSVITVGLLFNNFQLKLSQDRKLVKSMQLIGAKSDFILKPYLRSALIIGSMSFFLSVVILLLLITLLMMKIDLITEVLNPLYILYSLLLVFIISLVIPFMSTYITVSLYLKQFSKLEQ